MRWVSHFFFLYYFIINYRAIYILKDFSHFHELARQKAENKSNGLYKNSKVNLWRQMQILSTPNEAYLSTFFSSLAMENSKRKTKTQPSVLLLPQKMHFTSLYFFVLRPSFRIANMHEIFLFFFFTKPVPLSIYLIRHCMVSLRLSHEFLVKHENYEKILWNFVIFSVFERHLKWKFCVFCSFWRSDKKEFSRTREEKYQ